MGKIAAVLLVAAVILYALSCDCDGRGAEAAIQGLMLFFGSVISGFAGLLCGAFALGHYCGRRKPRS